jgi:DNA-directed RNA polymerase beta' subunit
MDDVKKLVAHTRPAYSSGLFKQTIDHKPPENLEEIERYELQELFSKCLEKVDYIIANAQDSEEFNLMMPDNLKELSDLICAETKQFGFSEKELELLFKHLARDTEEIIREHELGGSGEDDELMDRDANELAYYIQVKVMDFLKMIEKLKEMSFQKIKGSDAVMVEETKEQVKTAPLTKIVSTEVPIVKEQHSLVASEVSDKPETSKE